MLRMPNAGDEWVLKAPEKSEGWQCPRCGDSWGQGIYTDNGAVVCIMDVSAGAYMECGQCKLITQFREGVVGVEYISPTNGLSQRSAVPYTWLEPVEETR